MYIEGQGQSSKGQGHKVKYRSIYITFRYEEWEACQHLGVFILLKDTKKSSEEKR